VGLIGVLRLDPVSGWIEGVRRLPSPNFDARPAGADAEIVVVHNISLPPGEFGGPYVERLFTNTLDPDAHPYFRDIAHQPVSAHLFVDRRGVVTQFVSLHDRAWHAGVSSFRGRERCNDFSIGIELEGADHVPFEHAQYDRLAALIDLLRARWPVLADVERLVGHSDVAPGRKTDPGPAFDWARLRRLLGWARTPAENLGKNEPQSTERNT
jgi:AmpD protein